jgi:hypothetical protein
LGKKELEDFCYQFGFQDPFESKRRSSHRNHKMYQDDNKKSKHPINRRKPKRIYNKENISTYLKREPKQNDLVCFKCGQKGQRAPNCFKSKIKQEIQALLESESKDIKERLD